MDVFIATENIRRFNSLLQTEKGVSKTRLLLELLGLEKEKLAAAVAAQAKTDSCCGKKGLANTPSSDAA